MYVCRKAGWPSGITRFPEIWVQFPTTAQILYDALLAKSRRVWLSCIFRSLLPGKGWITWSLALVTHQWEDGKGSASYGMHRNHPSELVKKEQTSRSISQIAAFPNTGIFGLQAGARYIKLLSVKDSEQIWPSIRISNG